MRLSLLFAVLTSFALSCPAFAGRNLANKMAIQVVPHGSTADDPCGIVSLPLDLTDSNRQLRVRSNRSSSDVI